MHRSLPTFSLIVTLATVAACGQTVQTADVTRAQSPMAFAAAETTADERLLLEQADALRDMTAAIKRKATFQGAAIGAVAGCGLSFVAGSGRSQCLTAAAAGGAIGGVAGYQVGQQIVEKRIELIDVNRALPVIKQATDSAEFVVRDVPSVLALQDQEMEKLSKDLSSGMITQASFEQSLEDIRARRAALADVLSLSARQAAEARAMFEDAQAHGQTGLAWYVHAVRAIEQDALSARANISLL